jgi:hypothetical protein
LVFSSRKKLLTHTCTLYTVQKRAAFTFGFSHTACKYPLFDGHYKCCFIFGEDLRVIYTSASLDYMKYAGMCITLLIAYSSDADVDNA